MEKHLTTISKFLSLALRHQPEKIGLQLDGNGWANLDELIEKMNAKSLAVDMAMIETVVATNDKKRFIFNENKTSIRANQGHSIEVELNLQPTVPPAILYHGTAEKFLPSILQNGLQKQSRQHVHLSGATDTAKNVGSRHGKPVVLTIDTKAMHEEGFVFYLSENKVWLTDAVPVQYISQ